MSTITSLPDVHTLQTSEALTLCRFCLRPQRPDCMRHLTAAEAANWPENELSRLYVLLTGEQLLAPIACDGDDPVCGAAGWCDECAQRMREAARTVAQVREANAFWAAYSEALRQSNRFHAEESNDANHLELVGEEVDEIKIEVTDDAMNILNASYAESETSRMKRPFDKYSDEDSSQSFGQPPSAKRAALSSPHLLTPIANAQPTTEDSVSASQFAKCYQLILSKFENVHERLNTLTKEVKQLETTRARSEVSRPHDGYNRKADLPLEDYDSVLAFESGLHGPAKDEFVAYLSTFGGKRPEKLIMNVINATYSMDLQNSVTWKGKKSLSGGWSKPPLETTKIPHLMIGVAQDAFPKMTIDELLGIFRKYIMHASDRMRKFAAREAMMPKFVNCDDSEFSSQHFGQ